MISIYKKKIERVSSDNDETTKIRKSQNKIKYKHEKVEIMSKKKKRCYERVHTSINITAVKVT